MIEIDGSYGSGGGQILRTACGLTAITRKPCRIFKIRAGRPKPGLMSQHLLGVQTLARLCNGRLEGDFLGSEEIEFSPEEIKRDRVSVNIPTAGSITLTLQTLILPALFALGPIKIVFEGGATDTFFSPTIDYFRYVFLKTLERNGARVEMKILKRGYYPEGGARVEVNVLPFDKFRKTIIKPKGNPGQIEGSPPKLNFSNLTERGKFKRVLIISGSSDVLNSKKVAERQIAGAKEILGKLQLPTEERVEYYQTDCPGSQICLIAEFENTIIGTDNLGILGKRAEDVGKEAALELLKEQKSGACLDKYLGDQILPYLAISDRKVSVSISEFTDHLKTNIWVIEKFLGGRFEIEGNLITWNPLS